MLKENIEVVLTAQRKVCRHTFLGGAVYSFSIWGDTLTPTALKALLQQFTDPLITLHQKQEISAYHKPRQPLPR
ncbi:hypothetical protein Pmgp_03435 [Pelotomaculum propionicicum]|uniref:Uncharacterized protein n=1 Tax=Pelotomaculum propionicicum TaxID=258475 RepID=A0A4Y7RJN3_9FIRM|nr:hypothetical protein Pmgp_03435 [Pelotomaculum propionicicum]